MILLLRFFFNSKPKTMVTARQITLWRQVTYAIGLGIALAGTQTSVGSEDVSSTSAKRMLALAASSTQSVYCQAFICDVSALIHLKEMWESTCKSAGKGFEVLVLL